MVDDPYTKMPAEVFVGARVLVKRLAHAPFTPPPAMVMVPAPLVIVMPEPAVKVASTVSAPVEPMTNWPLMAWPRTVIAPLPQPRSPPPSVKEAAPVPPEPTANAVPSVRLPAIRASPWTKRSPPCRSNPVGVPPEPTQRASEEVAVPEKTCKPFRMESEEVGAVQVAVPTTRLPVVVALLVIRLVIVEEAALTRIPAAVLVGARMLVPPDCQAPLAPTALLVRAPPTTLKPVPVRSVI